MFINGKLRELSLKIVYYGPALSGKTTNLQYIYAHTNPTLRGELISLKTREDRTIFFDFLQLELGQVKGLKPKFHLYTVPGQVYYAITRKMVLQGADGVVFVADSQRDRLMDNDRSFQVMKKNLLELGYELDNLPMVIQFNKRDLPNAAPISLLRASLAPNGRLCFESIATQGVGVFDTLRAIIRAVVAHAESRLQRI